MAHSHTTLAANVVMIGILASRVDDSKMFSAVVEFKIFVLLHVRGRVDITKLGPKSIFVRVKEWFWKPVSVSSLGSIIVRA